MSTLSQSLPHETDNRPSSHLWFTTEIQHMMYGFGDCSKPSVESATLIEDIVFRQMSQLLYQVEEIAIKRNARFVGIEDFLFLLRKNKTKLHRLLRFLDFKDLKTAAVKSSGIEDEESSLDDQKLHHHKRRRKICQDFLNIIDQTGELLVLLDKTEDDEIKKERKMRAEIQTKNMSTEQYLEFCEARQASFAPRYKIQKFKDWVLSGVSLDIKPNVFALEILSYFAYETVAEIVDMALIVRRDKRVSMSDPFSHEMAPVCMNYEPLMTSRTAEQPVQALTSPGATSSIPISSSSSSSSSFPNTLMSPQTPKTTSASNTSSLFSNATPSNLLNKARKKRVISQQSKDLIASQAITTNDIYEALRRFCQPVGPFADFSKLPLIAVGQQLLCC